MSETKKKPIRAYSYLRVSTSMQVEGFSVDAQRNAINKHAYSKDMIVIREYAGFSISPTVSVSMLNALLVNILETRVRTPGLLST